MKSSLDDATGIVIEEVKVKEMGRSAARLIALAEWGHQKLLAEGLAKKKNSGTSVAAGAAATGSGQQLHHFHRQKHLTPSYLLYTRAGHIPHLTWSVVQKHLFDEVLLSPIAIQLTLPSISHSYEKIVSMGGGARAFYSLPPQLPIHLSFLDPLKRQSGGYNNNNSASIWSSHGRTQLTPHQLVNHAFALGAHTFSTLFDYDAPQEATEKRLSKTVARSKHFVQRILSELLNQNNKAAREAAAVNKHGESVGESEEEGIKLPVLPAMMPVPVFSLGGGFCPHHRQRFYKELHTVEQQMRKQEGELMEKDHLQKQDILHQSLVPDDAPVSIDLSQFSAVGTALEDGNLEGEVMEEFKIEEIRTLLADMIAHLPPTRPRLVEGVFNPAQIFSLINEVGIDIFDSSYASWLTEKGSAFALHDSYPTILLGASSNNSDGDSQTNAEGSGGAPGFEVLNLGDKSFESSPVPMVSENCQCYSCRNYSRAYLHHLLNTKEMLGPILLTIHNLHEFDRMFVKIRHFLQAKQAIKMAVGGGNNGDGSGIGHDENDMPKK